MFICFSFFNTRSIDQVFYDNDKMVRKQPRPKHNKFYKLKKYMENKLSEDDDSTLCELIKEKIMPHTKQLNSKTTKTYFSIITISDLY